MATVVALLALPLAASFAFWAASLSFFGSLAAAFGILTATLWTLTLAFSPPAPFSGFFADSHAAQHTPPWTPLPWLNQSWGAPIFFAKSGLHIPIATPSRQEGIAPLLSSFTLASLFSHFRQLSQQSRGNQPSGASGDGDF